MNHFIEHLNGDIVKPDGTNSNLMELLGVTADPLTVPNDGRGLTISAVVIGGKQYALSEILKQLADSRGGLNVKITGAGTELSPYAANRTFEEMVAADGLVITLNGTPASQISHTESDGAVTAIVANFVSFDTDEMDVTTLTIASTGITGDVTAYTLTEVTSDAEQ